MLNFHEIPQNALVRLLALLAIFMLPSCAQPQKNAYTASFNQCQALGFKLGTDSFAFCVQNDMQNRQRMALRVMGYM